MKKMLSICLLLACVATVTCAQSVQNNSTRKWFAEIGFSTLLLKPSDGAVMPFVGVALSGGKYVFKNSYVGAEFDFCDGTNGKEVGTFDYTKTINNGSPTYHTDGVIKLNYSATSILGFWDYAPAFSTKLHFNVGPVVGMTVFRSKYKFDPAVDNAPKMPSQTKLAFDYGGEIGLMYDVSEKIVVTAVGLRYRFLENSVAAFDNNNLQGMTHQISLVLNCTILEKGLKSKKSSKISYH